METSCKRTPQIGIVPSQGEQGEHIKLLIKSKMKNSLTLPYKHHATMSFNFEVASHEVSNQTSTIVDVS